MIQINGFCFLKLEALGYEACNIFTNNQYCQNLCYITEAPSVHYS